MSTPQMTGAAVDAFAQRLAEEMALLPREDRHELLVRIGKMENQMRAAGQDRPVWRGPLPESELLGAEVVMPTEHGVRRGRAVCFGIARNGMDYERSVVIYSAASGTNHEAPGSMVRLADENDAERIQGELAMAERLKEAAAGIIKREEKRRSAPARPKWERDPGLIAKMVALAQAAKDVFDVTEVGGCHKVEGRNRARRLYIHKKGLRVDISGFDPDGEAIIKISAEDAKRAHMGKVRGQVDFTDQAAGMAAFERLLKDLA